MTQMRSPSDINHPVVIRLATPDDVPTLARFNQLLAFESEHITLDTETITQGVAMVLDHPSLGRYYVACRGEEVIGQTMISFEPSDWRNGLVVWLQSVYVVHEHRRQGVFKALYQHIKDVALQMGSVRLIRLYVEKDNHQGLKTYRGVGMEQTNYLVFEENVSGN
jgi:GNAT superfamily N-acetyltransferase